MSNELNAADRQGTDATSSRADRPSVDSAAPHPRADALFKDKWGGYYEEFCALEDENIVLRKQLADGRAAMDELLELATNCLRHHYSKSLHDDMVALRAAINAAKGGGNDPNTECSRAGSSYAT